MNCDKALRMVAFATELDCNAAATASIEHINFSRSVESHPHCNKRRALALCSIGKEQLKPKVIYPTVCFILFRA